MPNFWKSVKIWPSYDENFEKFEVGMGSRVQFPGNFLEGRDPTLTPRNIDRFWKFFHFFYSLDRDKTFSFYKFCSVITQKCVNLTITRDSKPIEIFSLQIFLSYKVSYLLYKPHQVVTTPVKFQNLLPPQPNLTWPNLDFSTFTSVVTILRPLYTK